MSMLTKPSAHTPRGIAKRAAGRRGRETWRRGLHRCRPAARVERLKTTGGEHGGYHVSTRTPCRAAASVQWMLDELAAPYDLKILDFDKGDHKTPQYLEDQPDGQGAGDRAPRRRHHRSRRDLHLSRRRVSRQEARARRRRSAARHVPALDLLRRRLRRAGRSSTRCSLAPPSNEKERSATAATDDTLDTLETALTPGPYILGDRLQRRRRLRRLAASLRGLMMKALEPPPVFLQVRRPHRSSGPRCRSY